MSAGTAREKTRRLFLFLSPPFSRFVALDDDFDDAVTIFPLVFRHDSDADFDDAALTQRITDDIILYIYTYLYKK
jgi:hypothetical protein